MRRITLSFLSLSLLASSAYGATFGMNKVVTRKFEWRIASSPHFDLYFYKECEDVVPRVLGYLEKAYEKVGKKFGFYPPAKIKVFLYANHNDFEQSSLASLIAENTGAFTELGKFRIVLPSTPRRKDLESTVVHEYTHVVVSYMLGGDKFKSLFLLKEIFLFPDWLSEGISEYMAEDWDSVADMYMRDAVLSGAVFSLSEIRKFRPLPSYWVGYKQGQSMVQYISDRFGMERLKDFIIEVWRNGDIGKASMKAFGLPISKLERDWMDFLRSFYKKQAEGRKAPEKYGDRIMGGIAGSNPVFSPDGRKVAFLADKEGYADLFVMDLRKGSFKRLLKGKISRSIDLVRQDGKALSWFPDGRRIAFIGERSGKEYLCIVDVETGRLKRIGIPGHGSILSPDVSPDGRKLLFVSERADRSDICVMDMDTMVVKVLISNGRYNSYPSWSPDGSSFSFHSEVGKQLDVFIADADGRSVRPLISGPGDDFAPAWFPSGDRLAFISDRDGFNDLYELEIETGKVYRLTEVVTGIFRPSISPDGRSIAFTSYTKGKRCIYIGSIDRFSRMPSGEAIRECEVEEEPDFRDYLVYGSYTSFSPDFLALPWIDYDSRRGDVSFLLASNVSDMTGAHELYMEASISPDVPKYTGLRYMVDYRYNAMRPLLVIRSMGGTVGRREIKLKDWVLKDLRTTYNANVLLIGYPLDRFRRVEFGLLTDLEHRSIMGTDISANVVENAALIRITGDTTFLVPVQEERLSSDIRYGSRYQLFFYKATKMFKGSFDWWNLSIDYQRYIPIGRKAVLAARLYGELRGGPDRPSLSIGDEDRVLSGSDDYTIRGIPPRKIWGDNIGTFNLELRYDILRPEASIDLIWPGIYLRQIQGVISSDNGFIWDNESGIGSGKAISSIGLGLRAVLFLAKTMPITLRADTAYSLDGKYRPTFYLKLGQAF